MPGLQDQGGGPIMAVFKAPAAPIKSEHGGHSRLSKRRFAAADLLKFYLHFSAPMRRGHIYDYVHLRDDTGQDVEIPFLV